MRQDRNSPNRQGKAGRSLGPRARTLSLDITTQGARWTCLGRRSPLAAARSIAAALAANVELPCATCAATVLLSDDAHVRILNKQWRGFDKPTNVLSFPVAPSPGESKGRARHLGDLVLAEETLAREAAGMGIDAGDHYRHLVLHGLLHLLGYDHETDAQAEEMEALETAILATLGIADPYAGTEPVRVSTRPRDHLRSKPARRSRT